MPDYTIAIGSMEPKDRWCGSAKCVADAIEQAINHNGGVEPKFIGIWRQGDDRDGESAVFGPIRFVGCDSGPKGGT